MRIDLTARAAACLFLFAAALPGAAVEPRKEERIGEVVRAVGEREIRFARRFTWRTVEVEQSLAAGDALRTGTYGNLALLLRDQTQVRIHRDSFLVLRQVREQETPARTVIDLEVGSLWARAWRAIGLLSAADGDDAEPVRVNTPLVAIGIRGTDWFVRVEPDGRSTLITLSGTAVMSNELGAVTVSRGEVAVAEKGKAPVKRVVADLVDRPLLALEYRFAWRELLRLSPRDDDGPADPALRRALARYDAGDLQPARALLTATEAGRDRPWRDLLRAMLALRDGEDATARAFIDRVREGPPGRPAMLAALAAAGLAIDRDDYRRAERALASVDRRAPADALREIFSLALMFMREEYDGAIAAARKAEERFPRDARLSALRAGFHLAAGDGEGMAEASERAVEVGPDDALAWHVRGVYWHYVALDPTGAAQAYRRAVSLNPGLAESWNNLALLRLELGDFDGALAAARQAVAARPRSVLANANLAAVLMLLDRIEEAAPYTARAAAAEPTHPQVLANQGFDSLYRANNEGAVASFSRAATADPTFPGVQTNLAISHYQEGDFAAARQAIEEAVRMDPDDPVAALVGSTMALDQSDIGASVRFARRGLDNALRFGTFAVENLANTQSGIMSVGAAYSALGLGEWGDYYAQRVFDPYVAQSYSFLANRYPSARTRQAAAGQSLLLDPTGVSTPSRYFQFLRQPHYDLSASTSLGRADGASSIAGSVTASGHLRAPAPVSYALSASASDAEGARTNADTRGYSLLAAAGIRSNQRRDNFVLALSSTRDVSGIPGVLGDEDEDDGSETQSTFASLGYQRRFGYANRIFARIGIGRSSSTTRNPRPFGAGLSDLELSLIRTFGLEAARTLLAGGTFDSTAVLGFPDSPVLLTDPVFGPATGFELIRMLPARVDLDPVGTSDTRTEQLDLQFRHLFDADGTQLTWGGEWMPRRQHTRTDGLLFDPRGVGFVIPDLLAFPAGAPPFLFGGTTPFAFETDTSPTGGQVWLQASREFGRSLLVEGGVFARYVDDGSRDLWQFDPRAGIAWEPARGHWLRLAYQRELGHPGALNGTLAPVAAVGLVVPDDLVLLDGATVRDYRAQWDAEWSQNLFTFVTVSHQNQDLVLTNIPQTEDALVAGETELTSIRAGVNLWLADRFGVSAVHRVNRSRIVDPVNRNERLGLLPRNTTAFAVNWIHPNDLRLSAVVSRVGQRYADNSGLASLSPYWTTGLNASWQFFRRHGAISMSITNLFDRQFELAGGVPGPGRAALLTLTARY